MDRCSGQVSCQIALKQSQTPEASFNYYQMEGLNGLDDYLYHDLRYGNILDPLLEAWKNPDNRNFCEKAVKRLTLYEIKRTRSIYKRWMNRQGYKESEKDMMEIVQFLTERQNELKKAEQQELIQKTKTENAKAYEERRRKCRPSPSQSVKPKKISKEQAQKTNKGHFWRQFLGNVAGCFVQIEKDNSGQGGLRELQDQQATTLLKEAKDKDKCD